MKKKIQPFMFLAVLLFIASCSSEDMNKTDLVNSKKVEPKAKIFSQENLVNRFEEKKIVAAKVECEGECGCAMTIHLPTQTGQCGCDDCTLVITYRDANGNIINDFTNKDNIIGSVFDLDLFKKSSKDMVSYLFDHYNIEKINYEGIEFYVQENSIGIRYEFRDLENNLQTVLYIQHNNTNMNGNKIAPITYRVECDGPCGCKERWNFPKGTAECSCNDCTMTVEVLD